VHIAERIGFPVVLKILSRHIIHKVDIGGVILDVADAEQVRAAFGRLMANARQQSIEFDGIAIQKMIKVHDGVELILGAKKDPTFGMVLMVGSGGVAAEVVGDRALGLPPLNERHARRMLESLRLWPILQGYRNLPAANIDRLIETIIRFSLLISDYPEIREFEINPLLVTPRDVVALDAAALVDGETASPGPRTRYSQLAIRPYPDEYRHRARLKDGTPVTLRSVKPEDEDRWHAFIASASLGSIQHRFHSLFKAGTHELAIDQCFIDYEREIGIAAELESSDGTTFIGVAHLLSDVNRNTAEFAVMVADAWQSKGLGGILLDYCLELAHRWQFKQVVAETTPGNQPMLALFRSRGFDAEIYPEDDVVNLRKSLAPTKRTGQPADARILHQVG
jgi:acetyltransferase